MGRRHLEDALDLAAQVGLQHRQRHRPHQPAHLCTKTRFAFEVWHMCARYAGCPLKDSPGSSATRGAIVHTKPHTCAQKHGSRSKVDTLVPVTQGVNLGIVCDPALHEESHRPHQPAHLNGLFLSGHHWVPGTNMSTLEEKCPVSPNCLVQIIPRARDRHSTVARAGQCVS